VAIVRFRRGEVARSGIGEAMTDESEQPKGFQVKDRRRFTETGEVRNDAERDEPVAPSAAPAPPAGAERREASQPEALDHEAAEISLSTFLMSLSTQALMCLGEIPNPVTGKPEADLVAVRELIDIIAMLQEKTRGNLDAAEARLFEKVLFDLRMRFVEKARK
jgi:uncharacterized protein DUF1844